MNPAVTFRSSPFFPTPSRSSRSTTESVDFGAAQAKPTGRWRTRLAPNRAASMLERRRDTKTRDPPPNFRPFFLVVPTNRVVLTTAYPVSIVLPSLPVKTLF